MGVPTTFRRETSLQPRAFEMKTAPGGTGRGGGKRGGGRFALSPSTLLRTGADVPSRSQR